MTEKQKQRKLQEIERLKNVLKAEKRKFGGIHDGRGFRYVIAEQLVELNEFTLANNYLKWFNKNFPDDYTYAYFQFCAAVTKYQVGKLKEAEQHLIQVNRHNTYILELLIDDDMKDQDKYEWNESETLEYTRSNLPEFLKLMTPVFHQWLSKIISEPSYISYYRRYISIKKLLKDLNVSKERNNLLDAERMCLKAWLREAD
jgi:hypothetical protein